MKQLRGNGPLVGALIALVIIVAGACMHLGVEAALGPAGFLVGTSITMVGMVLTRPEAQTLAEVREAERDTPGSDDEVPSGAGLPRSVRDASLYNERRRLLEQGSQKPAADSDESSKSADKPARADEPPTVRHIGDVAPLALNLDWLLARARIVNGVAAKATAGQWWISETDGAIRSDEADDEIAEANSVEDAQFIAEARTDVPALAGHVEQLVGEVRRLRGELVMARDEITGLRIARERGVPVLFTARDMFDAQAAAAGGSCVEWDDLGEDDLGMLSRAAAWLTVRGGAPKALPFGAGILDDEEPFCGRFYGLDTCEGCETGPLCLFQVEEDAIRELARRQSLEADDDAHVNDTWAVYAYDLEGLFWNSNDEHPREEPVYSRLWEAKLLIEELRTKAKQAPKPRVATEQANARAAYAKMRSLGFGEQLAAHVAPAFAKVAPRKPDDLALIDVFVERSGQMMRSEIDHIAELARAGVAAGPGHRTRRSLSALSQSARAQGQAFVERLNFHIEQPSAERVGSDPVFAREAAAHPTRSGLAGGGVVAERSDLAGLAAREAQPVRLGTGREIWPYIIDQTEPSPKARMGDGALNVLVLLAADMRARHEVGMRHYGEPLRAFNGRDALKDSYEERLDTLAYDGQRMEEAFVEAPGTTRYHKAVSDYETSFERARDARRQLFARDGR